MTASTQANKSSLRSDEPSAPSGCCIPWNGLHTSTCSEEIDESSEAGKKSKALEKLRLRSTQLSRIAADLQRGMRPIDVPRHVGIEEYLDDLSNDLAACYEVLSEGK